MNCQWSYAAFSRESQAVNLLENDRHPDVCIDGACNISHPNHIRAMFGIISTDCSPSPAELWERSKTHLAGDIFRRIRKENSCMNINFRAQIYNEALIMTEDLCLEIANKVLNQLGMPSRNRPAAASFRVELRREQNYNTDNVSSYVQLNNLKIRLEQNGIYYQIMHSVNNRV